MTSEADLGRGVLAGPAHVMNVSLVPLWGPVTTFMPLLEGWWCAPRSGVEGTNQDMRAISRILLVASRAATLYDSASVG